LSQLRVTARWIDPDAGSIIKQFQIAIESLLMSVGAAKCRYRAAAIAVYNVFPAQPFHWLNPS
jgi:hypothetical protein